MMPEQATDDQAAHRNSLTSRHGLKEERHAVRTLGRTGVQVSSLLRRR
jgi:hypothetical protein